MSLQAQRSNLGRIRGLAHCDCFVAALLAMTMIVVSAEAAERQDCVHADIVLWGDGRHDDTAALSAWLRGAEAIWATSGEPVGAAIAGHSFRLSDAVYVPGGSGRRLEDFRLLWPERGETVSGGTIVAGSDPDKPPTASGISIVGGDPGEGVPFEVPDPSPSDHHDQASCATS
jgi:hypothetical protein